VSGAGGGGSDVSGGCGCGETTGLSSMALLVLLAFVRRRDALN
jgi:uncharacterized protein (TIGR03382 family)